jgi:anthranilate phosphoribosyltransferase
MNIHQAIQTVINKQDLTTEQMQEVMTSIMSGEVSEVLMSGFLCALATKGESITEIVGAAKVMRELSTKVAYENTKHLVDTCGTGGDGKGIFNVSTASSFVVASSGAKVAKHGNRSISSKSGSADVLELAGVNLAMTPDEIKKSVETIGIGFMFAQNHHSAMRHAIGVRKELGLRTIFNLLGPLTNPAGAQNQVIGVYNKALTTIFAKVLQQLGARHALVVHSADGLDEISIADTTFISELKDGKINEYEIHPQDFGISLGNLADIKAGDSKQSLQLIQDALDGKEGAARDIVALNAGAAIYASGKKQTLKDGINAALEILKSGSAHQKLDDFVRISTGC